MLYALCLILLFDIFKNISGLNTIFLEDNGDNVLKNIPETDQDHVEKFIIGASEPKSVSIESK